MRRRSTGAIATYKAAVRKIRRDRAAGRLPAAPAHLSSGRYVALQDAGGQWRVFSPPSNGPPFERSRQVAGPFDYRADADAWIEENAP